MGREGIEPSTLGLRGRSQRLLPSHDIALLQAFHVSDRVTVSPYLRWSC